MTRAASLGDVSPWRMKYPDGPSPRNSLNQDSCSTSSFRIDKDKSYVRWSLPAEAVLRKSTEGMQPRSHQDTSHPLLYPSKTKK